MKDVTAVQIAIWNEGYESIKKENILRPFKIKLEKNTQILEADIRKKSRDLLNIYLDKSNMDNGELEIQWDILEHNDGLNLQLVYLGDTKLSITADATIEGQGEIEAMEFSGNLPTPNEQYSNLGYFNRLLGWAYAIMGVSILVLGSIRLYLRKKQNKLVSKVSLVGYVLAPLIMVIIGLYFILLSNANIGPPFGF